ncbi:hypothetical protein, partial [Meiothermus hypogaeus]|uniref:hypothetical protein n=1 Tax=Meiothermus hypogaeus TaxID=884155 RepID=UPI001C98FC36
DNFGPVNSLPFGNELTESGIKFEFPAGHYFVQEKGFLGSGWLDFCEKRSRAVCGLTRGMWRQQTQVGRIAAMA